MDSEEKQCRTCLIKNEALLKINISIAGMIKDITSLLVSLNDKLSQWVCIKCEREIRRSHEFRKQCLEAAEVLSAANSHKFENIKPKEEPVDSDSINIEIKIEPKMPEYDNIDVEENWNSMKAETENLNQSREYTEEIPVDYCSFKIIFDCPFCHGPFYDFNVFDKHLKLIHPDRNEDVAMLIQSRPPLGFVSKIEEKDRRKYKKKNLQYKCACSNFVATEYPALLEHFKEHFGSKHILCTLCDYRCEDINLLKDHILIHTSEKPFACSMCNYTCKNKKALRVHSATHSSEKKYQCKQCPLTFKRASALSRHKTKVHDQKKDYVCRLCDKKFTEPECLKQHMIIHTGERPHICNKCGQAFAQEHNLKMHISLKHDGGERLLKYKCDLCSYASKQKGHLKTHLKRHKGEKNFKCDHCSFDTVSKYALTLHIMRHFGQKRFSCDFCDYKGMTISEIKQHRLNHTGEKPFACALCDFSGKYSRDLKKHLLIHKIKKNTKAIVHRKPKVTLPVQIPVENKIIEDIVIKN